jgi:polysaccharide export outer membrane protein
MSSSYKIFLIGKINIFVLLNLFLAVSCVNTKKAIYFNDIQDSTISLTLEGLEPVIQKNDLLSITVSSLNLKATETFNAPNTVIIQASTTIGSNIQVTGYLVNQDGYIKFPILGNIRAAGLTKKALTDNITKNLIDSKQLLDPIVTIRYLNYRVTILGEVAHPTVVNVPDEKITLLEAIGLAGDLTLYAKRENVLVLREENGKRIIKRLNLNSNEILTSPYFYLKSNDIVYVEPNKARLGSISRANQWLPVVISGFCFAIIVVDRLVRP